MCSSIFAHKYISDLLNLSIVLLSVDAVKLFEGDSSIKHLTKCLNHGLNLMP